MAKDMCQLQKDVLSNKKVMAVLSSLSRMNYICAVARTDDGVYIIDYVREGDLAKPSIRIEGERIVIPAGSPIDLLTLLLGG